VIDVSFCTETKQTGRRSQAAIRSKHRLAPFPNPEVMQRADGYSATDGNGNLESMTKETRIEKIFVATSSSLNASWRARDASGEWGRYALALVSRPTRSEELGIHAQK
jgi:hypothetical protein